MFQSIFKVFNEFSKTFFWLEDEEGGYCGWKFQVHRYFGIAIATLPLFQHPENVIISIFSLHFPSRNAISLKVFNEFSKTYFFLKDEEGCYCGWKFQVHRYFGFAIATLPLFQHPENVIISIFPLHFPSRNAISSKVLTNFQKLTFSWNLRKVAIVVEIWLKSSAQIFWLCNSNVTTFPTSRKCENFIFFPSQCSGRNAQSPKVFNEF